MAQWLLAILTAALGYLVHWGQQVLTWRYEHRKEQRDQIFSMREKLVELRELTDDQARLSTRPVVRRLASDAGLLRDEALRARVSRDVRFIGGAWIQEHRGRTSGETFLVNAFVDDAYECLSATLRGDLLPLESDKVLYILFDREKAGEEAMWRWMMNGDDKRADGEWVDSFAAWRAKYVRHSGRRFKTRRFR